MKIRPSQHSASRRVQASSQNPHSLQTKTATAAFSNSSMPKLSGTVVGNMQPTNHAHATMANPAHGLQNVDKSNPGSYLKPDNPTIKQMTNDFAANIAKGIDPKSTDHWKTISENMTSQQLDTAMQQQFHSHSQYKADQGGDQWDQVYPSADPSKSDYAKTGKISGDCEDLSFKMGSVMQQAHTQYHMAEGQSGSQAAKQAADEVCVVGTSGHMAVGVKQGDGKANIHDAVSGEVQNGAAIEGEAAKAQGIKFTANSSGTSMVDQNFDINNYKPADAKGDATDGADSSGTDGTGGMGSENTDNDAQPESQSYGNSSVDQTESYGGTTDSLGNGGSTTSTGQNPNTEAAETLSQAQDLHSALTHNTHSTDTALSTSVSTLSDLSDKARDAANSLASTQSPEKAAQTLASHAHQARQTALDAKAAADQLSTRNSPGAAEAQETASVMDLEASHAELASMKANGASKNDIEKKQLAAMGTLKSLADISEKYGLMTGKAKDTVARTAKAFGAIGTAFNLGANYQNSPLTTKIGQAIDAIVGTKIGAFSTKNPIAGLADALTAGTLSGAARAGVSALGAIAEGIVTGNFQACENFTQAAKDGKYGPGMDVAVTAVDAVMEAGFNALGATMDAVKNYRSRTEGMTAEELGSGVTTFGGSGGGW